MSPSEPRYAYGSGPFSSLEEVNLGEMNLEDKSKWIEMVEKHLGTNVGIFTGNGDNAPRPNGSIVEQFDFRTSNYVPSVPDGPSYELAVGHFGEYEGLPYMYFDSYDDYSCYSVLYIRDVDYAQWANLIPRLVETNEEYEKRMEACG